MAVDKDNSIQYSDIIAIQSDCKHNENAFTLVENPVTDLLKIQVQSADIIMAALNIFDAQGKRIFSTSVYTTDGITIPVSDLQNGVYFVQLQTDQFTTTKTFVKQ